MNTQHQPPDARRAEPPDELTRHLAYAEAAVMLMESVLLTLFEQGVLTKEQIVATVEAVISTKRQMVFEHDNPEIATIAAGVLRNICNSVSAADR